MGTEPNRSGRRRARLLAVTLVAALAASLLSALAFAGSASAADWTVSLRLTKSDARKLTLRADANHALTGSGYTLAIWDTTTGARLKACNVGATACDNDVATSLSFTPTASTTELSSVAHSYVATIAEDGDSLSYPPSGVVVTSDPQTADPWTVQLHSTVLQSKQIQLTAATNYSVPGSGYTLAIFDRTTGALLKSCNSGDTPCEGSGTTGNYFTRVTFVPRAGSTELSSIGHEYVAVLAGVYDQLPADNVAATSAVVTSEPWRVSVSVAQTSGRLLQVTAVSNYNVAPSGYTLAIFDKTTGALVKSCNSGDTTCSGSSSVGYYWTRTSSFSPRGETSEQSGVPHEYVAVLAGDASTPAGDNVAATSEPATVPGWTVALTAATTSDGRSFGLTASSTTYSLNTSGYTLGIYDRTTGERLAVCGAGYASCNGNSSVSNYWLRVSGRSTGWTDSYVAVIGDDSATVPGDNVAATSDPVTPE
jgi:hypothetical protein